MPGLAYFLRVILDASVHFIVVFLVSSPAEVQMVPGLTECSQADMAASAFSLQLCSADFRALTIRAELVRTWDGVLMLLFEWKALEHETQKSLSCGQKMSENAEGFCEVRSGLVDQPGFPFPLSSEWQGHGNLFVLTVGPFLSALSGWQVGDSYYPEYPKFISSCL